MGEKLREWLTSKEWSDLDRQRGEDFHRWRYESPYVTGINKSSRWVDDPEKHTRTLGFGGAPEYTEATDVVDEVCRIAHAALVGLEHPLRGVREAFYEAQPFVTEGRTQISKHGAGTTKVTDLRDP